MHLNRRLTLLVVSVIGLAATSSFAFEGIQDRSKKTVRLQYRTAGDALKPSGFLDVSGGRFRIDPFILAWRLPELSGEKKKVQQEQVKAFHDLIERLERDGVNGLEFDCIGQYENSNLVVLSIPQLTKESRERLRKLADSK